MQKRHVPIKYRAYAIHATDEFNKSVYEAYIFLTEAYSLNYADRWLDNVNEFIARLESPNRLGNIDPKNFSDTYAHLQVTNTQTTIFLLVEENQIYLATSGWSRLPWPQLLKETQQHIDRQIEKLRQGQKA